MRINSANKMKSYNNYIKPCCSKELNKQQYGCKNQREYKDKKQDTVEFKSVLLGIGAVEK